MKQAFSLLLVVFGLLVAGRAVLGEALLHLVVHGAMALMALMIAGTFLWLWFERATPLALGMVHAWAGAAVFSGWWWAVALTGRVDWEGAPGAGLAVPALFLVGAVLHFSVIHRSFGLHGAAFLWPVGLTLAISSLVAALV